jgi:serine/threonine protein kinase/Tfp pilus assembly protein PilF
MLEQTLIVRPFRTTDEYIVAFKDAWKQGLASELADFLPPETDPSFADVLRVLIKVDMRMNWEIQQRKLVGEYRQLFPVAFQDERFEVELAVEEYHFRLFAGETVDVAEYRQRYGSDVAAWRVAPSRRQVVERSHTPRKNELKDTPPPQDRPTARFAVTSLRQSVKEVQVRSATGSMPSAGESFLHFELARELGRGAFGRVFLARQKDLSDRFVALKITMEADGEPQILARLQHTNIVPIHAVYQCENLQAICMPYFGSVTLARVIQDLSKDAKKLPNTGRGMLSTLFEVRQTIVNNQPQSSEAAPAAPSVPAPEEPPTLKLLGGMTQVDAALWIAARIADGLSHAHEHGVLHCDLKPANILIADDGQPMLLDFNVAADHRTLASKKLRRIGGTLPYMAPEYLELAHAGELAHGAPTPRCDLYSLGAVLYELLTGRLPFEEPAKDASPLIPIYLQLHRRRPMPPSRLNSAITPAVDAVVLKLLEPDPAKRYAEAAHVREDLDRQLANRPLAHARDSSVRERLRKWRRRNPRLTAALSVALAALFLLVLPSAVIAIRQNQLAERRLEIERAEAIVAQQHAVNELKTSQILLSTRTLDREMIREGLERGKAVLNDYGIGANPAWATQPKVARLPADKRDALRKELGETLLLFARCELALHPDGDRAAAEAALLWNRLAEACYPPDGRPRLLATQRAVLAAILPDQVELIPEPNAAPEDAYHEALELATANRHADALVKLAPFADEHPDHFMAWYVRGVCHEGVAQYTEAVGDFTVCATLWPEFPWTYFNRGVVRLKQGRFEQAEADFSRALARRSGWLDALINRAIARDGKRDFTGAERDLTEALESPDCPTRCYFIRAKVRRAKANNQGADRDVAEGRKREPADVLSWVVRGVWKQPTDPKGALADYDQALKLNPRSVEALHNKAVVLADSLNRPKEAAAVMSQLLDLYPRYTEGRAGRGLYLARVNDAAPALADVLIVLQEEPTSFRLYQMAGVYALLAKSDSTGKHRQEALRLVAKAFQSGFDHFEWIPTDPDIAPLRDDPEFRKLVDNAKKVAEVGRGKDVSKVTP